MGAYATDAARWSAVQGRDAAADGAFVYGVRTTKIYCRPICKARLARRANLTFYETAQEAQGAGFRACKRCRPEEAGSMPEEAAVQKIRAFVTAFEEAPRAGQAARLGTLRQMAEQTGLSKWHFHRVFKQVLGMTPRAWVTAAQSRHASSTGDSIVSDLEFDKYFDDMDWDLFDGFGAYPTPSASYPTPGSNSAVTASETAAPSPLLESPLVSYTIQATALGFVLLAYQNERVCMVHHAASESEVMATFHDAYPAFIYRHAFFDTVSGSGGDKMQRHAAGLVAMLEQPVSEV